MKPQVIELQVENKNMDEMNKMITKTLSRINKNNGKRKRNETNISKR